MSVKEILAPELRDQAFAKTLYDDAGLTALTTGHRVVWDHPDVEGPDASTALKCVSFALAPGGGRFGHRQGVTNRYSVDVWVDAAASADPPTDARKIGAAVFAALTPAALSAALTSLGVSGVHADARVIAFWQNVPEPDLKGTVRLTATLEVRFVQRA